MSRRAGRLRGWCIDGHGSSWLQSSVWFLSLTSVDGPIGSGKGGSDVEHDTTVYWIMLRTKFLQLETMLMVSYTERFRHWLLAIPSRTGSVSSFPPHSMLRQSSSQKTRSV